MRFSRNDAVSGWRKFPFYLFAMPEISFSSIPQWAEDDRPREKLVSKGRDALSDAELLAIILGSGSRHETALGLAQRILLAADRHAANLSKLSMGQLLNFKGIGQAKAVTLLAALELGRRCCRETKPDLDRITSSESVFKLMQPLIGDLPHEEFWIIYLNNSNKVLSKVQLSKGGITGTVVDVRLVFKKAFELGATSLILCHNHPSGSLTASDADRQITKKLKNAGESMEVRVIDHVIITVDDHYSFSDEGIL